MGDHALWAIALGFMASGSLLLGSVLGVSWRPSTRILSILTAFGGGALTGALLVELVGPVALCAADHDHCVGSHGSEASPQLSLVMLMVGMVAGGMGYFLFDRLLARFGASSRKLGGMVAMMGDESRDRHQNILEHFAKIPGIRDLPSEDLEALIREVDEVHLQVGETLFERGDPGDGLYFVNQGLVGLSVDGDEDSERVEPGGIVGEISVLTESPRVVSACAESDSVLFRLSRDRVVRLREQSQPFDQAMRQLAGDRLQTIAEGARWSQPKEAAWARDAAQALHAGAALPSPLEIRKMADEDEGSPLAIWLGLLLDGIPEMLVLGAGLATLLHAAPAASFAGVIPFALLAGLFLSNFPESLSSSVVMRISGWGRRKVLLMWGSLAIILAAMAWVGFVTAELLFGTPLTFVEGFAVGAVLVMLGQSMIPEAVHLSNPRVVGLSLLAGVLAVLAFALLG